MNGLLPHPSVLTAILIGLFVASAGAKAGDVEWFDKDVESLPNADNAFYKGTIADTKDGPGWPLEIRTVESNELYWRTYSASPTWAEGDTSQKVVGSYELYETEGERRLSEVGVRNLDGELNGLVVEFNRRGEVASVTPYKNGVIQGEYLEYQLGDLVSRTPMVDGKAEGFQTTYSLGHVSAIEEAHDGLLDGVAEYYGDDRSDYALRLRVHFRDGNRRGWTREWDWDGNLLRETHYVDDEKDGIDRQWTDETVGPGRLDVVERYRAGERRGLQQTYDSEGALVQEMVIGDDGQTTSNTYYTGGADSRISERTRVVASPDGDKTIKEQFNDYGYLWTRTVSFADTSRSVREEFQPDGRITYRTESVNGEHVGLHVDQSYDETDVMQWRRYDAKGRLNGEQLDYHNDATGQIAVARRWQMEHGNRVDDASSTRGERSDQ